MAKTAAKRSSAAKASAAAGGGGAMRPMLIAAGLSLYWFVAYQDAGGGAADVPVWIYAIMVGARLLADFVGALVIVYALQLLLVLSRLVVSYTRGLWLQASSR